MRPLPNEERGAERIGGRATGRWAALLPCFLAACSGPQSALDPAGFDAEQTLRLFWVMLAGAVLIWIALNGLIFYVTRINIGRMSRYLAEGIIIGGGIVVPLIVLSALVAYSLQMVPQQRRPGGELSLRVEGERWWWRVEYWPEGAEAPIVSANEIRLPAGRRSDFALSSAKVIHSFWIPALGGKTDMFPGRVTETSLEPTTPGVYRGQCAEFCGLSHAFMAFPAVVMEEAEFTEWLSAQARPAQEPETTQGIAGQDIFLREGCGACHTVRGTPASGDVGPDLTHVGSRLALAAGILPTTQEALMRWISAPEEIKPGAEMPGYDHLPPEDLAALATYLLELE